MNADFAETQKQWNICCTKCTFYAEIQWELLAEAIYYLAKKILPKSS